MVHDAALGAPNVASVAAPRWMPATDGSADDFPTARRRRPYADRVLHLLCLLALAVQSVSEVPSPRPQGRVIDQAGVLQPRPSQPPAPPPIAAPAPVVDSWPAPEPPATPSSSYQVRHRVDCGLAGMALAGLALILLPFVALLAIKFALGFVRGLRQCRRCSATPHGLGDDELVGHLSPGHRLEHRLGSARFRGTVCACGDLRIFRRPAPLTRYRTCATCRTATVAVTTHRLHEPTTDALGLDEEHAVCRLCGGERRRELPRSRQPLPRAVALATGSAGASTSGPSDGGAAGSRW